MRGSFSYLMAAAVAVVCSPSLSPAEIVSDGTVDMAFDAGGFTNGDVYTSRIQTDGKVIVAGAFTRVHGVARNNLARLNADGTVDQSFVPWSGTLGTVQGIELLPEGRLLVWGYLLGNEPFGYPAPLVVRLNSDGSADASFTAGRRIARTIGDNNGVATDPGWLADVLVQPDGKIVVVGDFAYIYTAPGTYVARSCVARFNSDGTLDESFNPASGAQLMGGVPAVYHVALQSVDENSGKLVLNGSFDSFNGQPADEFVRLNGDGSVDQSFSVIISTTPFVQGILVQPNDDIVVFGFTRSSAGPAPIGRLKPNGNRDSGFEVPGTWRNYTSNGWIADVAQQADGKLLAGGSFHSIDGVAAHNVVRLEPGGARDTTFDASVATGPHAERVRAITVRPLDGRVFVGGDFSTYGGAARNNFAWVNSDGSVAENFAGLSGATEDFPRIYAMAAQLDGKIVVVGNFSSVNGSPRYAIVRLNADLSIDASFNAQAGVTGRLGVLLLQSDGKILIGGSMQAVNGVARRNIARLNSNGTLDTAFDPGAGADSTVVALAQDEAGNVYVAGTFSTFDGQPRNRIAKLSPTGALDRTFDPGAGPDGAVNTIALAPESSAIVIAGNFPRYNGVSVGRIARLNANTAALDTSFNSGGVGFDRSVTSLLRAANGKYYAGGSSRFNNVSPPSAVFRLNNDGSRDQSFVHGVIQSSPNPHLVLQGDTVYLVFDLGNKVIRLTNSGTIDSGFVAGNGVSFSSTHYISASVSPSIAALALHPDGKLLVGGTFTTYNNVPRVCLARLTDSKLNFTAVSRKTHGSSGPTFDLNLPLVGASAIESRSGGANDAHQLVLNFGGPVTAETAAITSGNGTVSNIGGSGTSTITLDLTGVSNAQSITVQLGNVSTGTSVTDVAVRMGVLLGDSNGDGTVNSGDALQTRNRSGQLTSASNFRSDYNLDGTINSGDALIVRGRSGQAIP